MSPALTNSLLPLPVDAETLTDNEPRLSNILESEVKDKPYTISKNNSSH
jgi:hypothetical protein